MNEDEMLNVEVNFNMGEQHIASRLGSIVYLYPIYSQLKPAYVTEVCRIEKRM